MSEPALHLFTLIKDHQTEQLKTVIADPDFDINNKFDARRYSALHLACSLGFDDILTLLLAHPDIDVNLRSLYGETPLAMACLHGKHACVKLLLRDPRVETRATEVNEFTYLHCAARKGRLEVIKECIISERKLYLGEPGDLYDDPIAAAWKYKHGQVAELLLEYKKNPQQTKFKVRLELGFEHELAAEFFALVVFVCDGLLKCRNKHPRHRNTKTRFFNMISQLPMELQMPICNKIVNLSAAFIETETAEVAFRKLGKSLTVN